MGTRLSKTAVNRILYLEDSEKDYRFGTLIRVFEFLIIKLFIGSNEEANPEVLSLFKTKK